MARFEIEGKYPLLTAWLPHHLPKRARAEVSTELTLYADDIGNKAPFLGVVASQDGVRVFTVGPRSLGIRVRSRF